MKKLLALVLALVMTLGLATVSSSAAFSDADSIKYTEAVDVMSALGVIAGMDDGSFNPTGSLTREQGAKILSYMLMGGKTGGDALTASSAPFTDVAADRWSAGAIAFCSSAGIIAGKGDGTFGPTEPLTGYAFAKMLLTALGYDAKREGLTGGDWELNTLKLVNRINLADGLSGVPFSSNITREQAAKLSLNTCMATMVEYSGNLTTDTQGNLSAQRTVVRNTSYSYVNNGNGTATSGNVSEGNDLGDAFGTSLTAQGDMQFIESYFPNMKLAVKQNDLGVDAHYWFNGGSRTDYTLTDAKQVNETETEEAVAAYTASAKESAVKTALKGYDLTGGAGGVDIYYNGNATATGVANLTEREIAAQTGNGTSVKVFANSSKEITKVVVVESFLGKVSKLDAANKEMGIVLQSTRATGTVTTDKSYGDYKVGDYLMVVPEYKTATRSTTTPCTGVTLEDDAIEIAPVTKLEGVRVTAKGSDNVTIDGTTYEDAANTYNGAAVVTGFTTGGYYDILLDTYNNVVKAEGNVTVNSDYIYVYSVYQSTDKGETTYYAYGADEDGKLITLNLGTTAATVDTALTAMGAGPSPAIATNKQKINLNWLCAYTTNNSTKVSTLLPLDDSTNNTDYKMDATNTTVQLATSTKMVSNGTKTFYLTADTKFVTMTGTKTSDVKVATYTGVRATSSLQTISFVFGSDGETVLLAFIPADAKIASDDVIYVKSTSTGSTLIGSDTVATYTGYKDNDKLTMPSDTNAPAYANAFYTYATDENGKYEFSEYTTKTVTGAIVDSVYNTLLSIEEQGSNYYWVEASRSGSANAKAAATFDAANIDGTKIKDLTDNGITTMAELANLVKTGGTVYVSFTYDKDNNITMLYIVKAIVTLTSASDTAVKSKGSESNIVLAGIKSEYLTSATVTVEDKTTGAKVTTDATTITDDGTDTTIAVSFTTDDVGDKVTAEITTSYGYVLKLEAVTTAS